jgi:hypothetical protein
MEGLKCTTGLKKDIINCEVFEREIALCRNLSLKNNGGCGWGTCNQCGVIPLLVKLHKGVLIEEPDEIIKARKDALN